MLQKRTNDSYAGCGVMVAVDESTSASDTLGWAASYARATALPLHALHVLQTGGVATPAFGIDGRTEFPRFGVPGALAMSPVALGGTSEITAEGAAAPGVLTTPPMVREAFESVDPEQNWTLEVVEAAFVGCVGSVLIDHATDASLLVVGRGRCTGFCRMLSGSVSHYCLSHAAVPVLAAPAGR